MDRLIKVIANARSVRQSDYDDFADRLSSRYSVVMLIAFAILVSINHYVRNPITCWAPNHFTKAHISYTTSFCWVRNTYYLPWDSKPLPPDDHLSDCFYAPPGTQKSASGVGVGGGPFVSDDGERRQVVPYYQWVPFILLGQAMLFYAPTILWRACNSRAGIDADSILESAQTIARGKGDARDKTIKTLTKHFDRFLGTRRKIDSRGGCGAKCILSVLLCRICARRVGCYILLLFLISKLLYIGNVIMQLSLLSRVLAIDYSLFGIDMIRNIIDAQSKGVDWTEDAKVGSVAFPRVTVCDLCVRGQDFGNVQRYSVQCVLPINTYTEKIYMLLWFWMMIVAFASVISLFMWLIRAIFTVDRVRFAANHLRIGGRIAPKPSPKESDMVRKFVCDYLNQDGSFLLRLIAHNTDNITVTELTCAIWDDWKDSHLVGADAHLPDSGNDSHSGGIYPDGNAELKALHADDKC